MTDVPSRSKAWPGQWPHPVIPKGCLVSFQKKSGRSRPEQGREGTHSLNEDLTEPDAPRALSQTGLHRLACPHDGHSGDLSSEADSDVGVAQGSGDLLGVDGKVVES